MTCRPSPAACTTSPTCSTAPRPSSRRPGAREEWRVFVDLALAMRKPLFGAKGVNGFVKTTRRIAKITRRPGLEFGPHWVDRLTVATSRKVNGRKLKWRDMMSHPHGMVLGPREFGHFKDALRTDDKKVHAAPPESSRAPVNCWQDRTRWRRRATLSSCPTGATGTR